MEAFCVVVVLAKRMRWKAGPRRKTEEAGGDLQHFESGSDYVEVVFRRLTDILTMMTFCRF